MEPIYFSELRKNQCALIDITSFSFLCKYYDELLERVGKNYYELIRAKLKTDLTFRLVINVLERMVAYEFVVVDELALKLAQREIPTTELLRKVEIPSSIVHEAGKRVIKLQEMGFVDFLEDRGDDWFDGEYKSYLDEVYKKLPVAVNIIADTNQSSMRFLYYLEISRQASIPVFLNPAKDRFFELLNKELKQETLKLIEKYADESIKNGMKKVFGFPVEVDIPPLGEYILRQALKENTSVLTAVSNIRKDKHVKGFRSWLWDIQRKLLADTPVGWIEAARSVGKFKEAVTEWGKALDLSANVTYKPRKISLGIGSKFTELLGLDIKGLDINIPIKDPILNRPSHLVFISEWYK